MSRTSKAYIAGIYEHPTRKAIDKTIPQLHAEVAIGALKDAGLTKDDVDGYFCDGEAPGLGGMSMAEYIDVEDLVHRRSSVAMSLRALTTALKNLAKGGSLMDGDAVTSPEQNVRYIVETLLKTIGNLDRSMLESFRESRLA